MASIGYFNDPAIGQAFSGLASMFAPPSAQDQYAAAKAAETAQSIRYRNDLAALDTSDPNYKAIADKFYTLNGDAPGYYNIDTQAATDITRAMLAPVGANETRFVPPSIADMYKVDPMQIGVVSTSEGAKSTLPSGQTIMGPEKPLTDSQVKGSILARQKPAVQDAAVLSDIPVETVMGANGRPEYVRRADAVGKQPIQKDSGISVTTNPDGTVSVTQGGGGKLTEVQGKYSLFSTRAANANQVMDKILASPYGQQLPAMDYVAGMTKSDSPTLQLLLNNAKTPEGRQYYQAAQDFLTTILRPDTGAAVTPTEFVMYGNIFIPMPGDDPGTIQQKNQARAIASQGLQALSNGGAGQIARLLAQNNVPIPPELQRYVQTDAAAPVMPQGQQPAMPVPYEGATATGPDGRKLILRGGQWQAQ